jgi:NAD+ synthase
VYIPIGWREPSERHRVQELCDTFRVDYLTVNLTDTVKVFSEGIVFKFKGTMMNLKPRLRMCALYEIAADNAGLVIGTSNYPELKLGYFTKYGDGGVDIEPIGHLLKGEVVKMAEGLKVPMSILEAVPSAGLYPGQTDTDEIGASYNQIDSFFKDPEDRAMLPKAIREKLEAMVKKNEHKRRMPPMIERKVL